MKKKPAKAEETVSPEVVPPAPKKKRVANKASLKRKTDDVPLSEPITISPSRISPVERSTRRARGPKQAVSANTASEDRNAQRSNAPTGEVLKVFPQNFLWGASTASYQVEGGIENTDWAQAARDGRVPPCGRACDHYNRFEQDFDLAVNLGHNAHRFSIEWARIEPEEGKFDEQEIEHYRQVLHALRVRNLKPFVTLWHFTQPLWFSKSGGFLRRDSAEIFARYCRFVVERLGGEAECWMTINEPEVWSTNSYLWGKWPPFKKNPITYIRMMRSLARAHRAAYRAIKEVVPSSQVGIAKHNNYFDASGSRFMRPVARLLTWFRNHWFLEMIEGHQDFIGLNQYLHNPLGTARAANAIYTDMGWEIHPESLFRCIMELARYRLPVYITENGLADAKDDRREMYIRGYLEAVHRSIRAGMRVRGYFYWSLLDNYEWAQGFSKRFGLIEVNYETLTRSIRPSARFYEKVARGNSL